VVVQSESFFDVRDIFAGIRPDILSAFDSIKDAAVCHGKIEVPAWGANTVRTEFAFLSGLEAGKLGVHRFNPYRKLARQGILTLAGVLKRLGYRTVCVHPYPVSFYARDKVFPLLGFDVFMDIRSFCESEKSGPNIGDVALAEKVCTLLEPSVTRPVFVFVITMENHGPLHLEKAGEGDAAQLYAIPPPDGCDDLTIYLKHLIHADCMAGILRDRLETLPGPAWLCWFGDHVPIMPGVYGALGAPDGKTDYVIWRKGGNPGDGIRRDVKIENLGCLLLEKMGVVSAPMADDPTRRHSEASS
jgi:phosphoglycerol transferase MdoB-like AlkP superfamily enzyme